MGIRRRTRCTCAHLSRRKRKPLRAGRKEKDAEGEREGCVVRERRFETQANDP